MSIGNKNKKQRHRKVLYTTLYKAFIAICLVSLFIVYWNRSHIKQQYQISTEFSNSTTVYANTTSSNYLIPPGYLVWSPNCQIPALDPFALDAMKCFTSVKYNACSTVSPLTKIKQNFKTNTVWLEIDAFAPTSQNLSCCYQKIIRAGLDNQVDKLFNLEPCVLFNKTVELPLDYDFIFVTCNRSEVINFYNNTHAVVRDRPSVRDRLDSFTMMYEQKNVTKRPLSVLMLSIDSVSRLNFMRAMPLTAKHLTDTGWFELQGYNKIDDNTFPNIMAILVGVNSTQTLEKCDGKILGQLDKCPLIWKDFHNAGYVTAYGEDEVEMSSFNYLKVGFTKSPTDFYMRPYMLAARKLLQMRNQHGLAICLGHNNSVDHLYQYAMDFATVYQNDPYFGLFWTNSFSHNFLSDPSSMDDKMKNYILQMEHKHILNDSMVIFFSDHGMRWGRIRKLVTGWLEERLPFIYISLPEWFKNENPHLVEALQINRNRLTNPYDLHMTLKHILELSQRTSKLPRALGCTNCQSIFNEMPYDRSCEDSAISQHWCTCSPYKPDDTKSAVVRNGVQFVIKQINDELANDESSRNNCTILELDNISNARKAEYHDENNLFDVILVAFTVTPSNGSFEATVKYTHNTSAFELTGSVSRLNIYAGQSDCIQINSLKKYCYCNELITNDLK